MYSVGIVATHSLPITTASCADTADGIKTAVEQLHSEFSPDVRPPCRMLCYAVSAGYSRVKNNAACTKLSIYITLEIFVTVFPRNKPHVGSAVVVVVLRWHTRRRSLRETSLPAWRTWLVRERPGTEITSVNPKRCSRGRKNRTAPFPGRMS